jgi:hypothetical protein
MKTYYHVIEDSGYGNIGTQGVYDNQEDAEKRANHLQYLFPRYTFYVYPSSSKREPEFVTL